MLIYLGYLAVRFSRRLRLPVVTSFLLAGIVVGPEGLGFVNYAVIGSLRIVEPIALGMITFAAGEQLRFADVRVFSGRHYVAVGLETILPVLLVGIGAWLLTGRLEVALPVGAIAGTTGLATVMSTLKESGARGDYARLLGFATASDNVFAILAFSLVLPLVAGMETGQAVGSLYAERLMGMGASVAIGCALGLLVSLLIRHVRSSTELCMFVLAHVLLMVGITHYLGFSVLLGGLAMGATAVNLTREIQDRERAFSALNSLEFPIIAVFFLWAGSSLHIRALASVGLLFAVYVVARSVGKLAGPIGTAWLFRKTERQARRFIGLGVSLLPQAGAAVGLAILARDSLPVAGQTILATVLGAVVVFELIGPVGVHWAARYVGEARGTPDDHPLTLEEAIRRPEDRKATVVVAVGPTAPATVMEGPQALAKKLDADLVVIPVSNKRATAVELESALQGSAEDSAAEDRHADDLGTESGTVVLVDDNHVGEFLELVKSLKPHVFFLALPASMHRLLGSLDAVAERIGCPVYEIPRDRSGRWAQLLSFGVASLDQVEGHLSQYREKLQPARILRLLGGFGKDR